MTLRLRTLVLAGLLACGSVPAFADVEGSDDCNPQSTTLQIAKVSKARIGDVIWERQPTWQISVRFRIGPGGVPEVLSTGRVEVTTRRAEGDEDKDALRLIAVDTLTGYRMCPPANGRTSDRWTATMLFTPVTYVDAYMQTFVPEYAKQDVRNRRQGRVVVRTQFATDGMPAKATVVKSSGDEVLDQKAVSSMLNNLLVTRSGLPLEKEFVFERPFTFEIH